MGAVSELISTAISEAVLQHDPPAKRRKKKSAVERRQEALDSHRSRFESRVSRYVSGLDNAPTDPADLVLMIRDQFRDDLDTMARLERQLETARRRSDASRKNGLITDPRVRARVEAEKRLLAVLWVWHWGFSTAVIINALCGVGANNKTAESLVSEGIFRRRDRTKNRPRIYTLTETGVEVAEAMIEQHELRRRDDQSYAAWFNSGEYPHDEYVQRMTLRLLKRQERAIDAQVFTRFTPERLWRLTDGYTPDSAIHSAGLAVGGVGHGADLLPSSAEGVLIIEYERTEKALIRCAYKLERMLKAGRDHGIQSLVMCETEAIASKYLSLWDGCEPIVNGTEKDGLSWPKYERGESPPKLSAEEMELIKISTCGLLDLYPERDGEADSAVLYPWKQSN